MNTIIIILLTLVIIITLLISLYIKEKSNLLYYKIRVDKAEKEIEDELDNRYKLVKEAEKSIKKSTKMDLKNFKELDELKSKNTISPIDLDNKLVETISTIYLIQDDYPKLAKKKDMKEILRNLDESDTKITAAKSFYNENNKKLIELIKRFPSNIIAKIKSIQIQPSYEVKEVFNENDDKIKI